MRLALVLAFAALVAGLCVTTPLVALIAPTTIAFAIAVPRRDPDLATAPSDDLPQLRDLPEFADFAWAV